MLFNHFPKIFAIGDRHIQHIFDSEVEITEKIDGSQFGFGKINNELMCRSKGQILQLNAPEKMFEIAVEYILSIQDKIPDNSIFYAEYLNKPKHNALAYNNVPRNNLALFGAVNGFGEFISKHEVIKRFATKFNIDTAPLLYDGFIDSVDEIKDLLETDSYLGKEKIEGVVVKNYNKEFFIAGRLYQITCGKYVSEKFKEKHDKNWKENSGKGKWETYLEGFRTEARWEKAIQHLKENGVLENNPRDIGNLMKEVQRDIVDEEKENIKNFLWKLFSDGLLRKSVAGLPEWYKEKLLNESFNKEE